MSVVKPGEVKQAVGAGGGSSAGAFRGRCSGSPWPLKRLPWQCKEQVHLEGSGGDRPTSLLPILPRTLTNFINNPMMNHYFNWTFIALA